MVLVKKKSNFYRAVIKLLGILFCSSSVHANTPRLFPICQHGPDFPGLPVPLLAPTSPQSLCPSSSHANTPQLFPVCQCPCWRRLLRKAFVLRRATPTRPGFFRFAGAHVGVDLPAKPLSFVEPRQHAPAFPDLPAPMLASTFPQSLCPSSSHANTPQLFPVCRCTCWRRSHRKAFVLR